MRYLLGIDGGGTQTVAWMADERGRVVARASAGPSNPFKVGIAKCRRELLRAAQLAAKSIRPQAPVKRLPRQRKIGRPRAVWPALEAVVVGLAGSGRPKTHRALLRWLRQSIPARLHLLTSDAAIALEAATGSSAGIIVISGTGSIALARDRHGNLLRVGGWGNLFDDLGSGFDLGRKAVMAALQDYDGLGPRTVLTSMIERTLNLREITDIVERQLTPSEVAALFRVVLKAANRRDRVARMLCDEAGRQLAGMALALLKKIHSRRGISVVCAGGVFSSGGVVLRSFTRHLHRHAPRIPVRLLRRAPVQGALTLARKIAGSKPRS
ncbi:MAG TPA: BadF/BadG/BcrA/BcrD ATPase family protein [Terriglobia bacterium]|nr:BadF/BadG/BcrA/BcrD ATPase family protein [Terriglobia bacterium]